MAKFKNLFCVNGFYLAPGKEKREKDQLPVIWGISSAAPDLIQTTVTDMVGLRISKFRIDEKMAISLKDVINIDVCNTADKTEKTCVRLVLSNGQEHKMELKKEKEAQAAVEKLTSLWKEVKAL